MSVGIVSDPPPGWPDWVDQTEFTVKDGRDPLGLETVTTDRIVPWLVPGILALSGRARYFSFHLFLLDEFRRRRLNPTPENQSTFFRMREFEFGAAVLLCARCGSTAAPVGAQSLRGIVRRATDQIDRGFSVDSDYGGYGLYYRSPLRDLGLILPRGTVVGDESIPVDVPAGPRADEIAAAFRLAVAETEYYRNYFMGDKPIPVETLRAFSEVACLCRLADYPVELRLVRSVFFDEIPGLEPQSIRRRQEAFALRLKLAEQTPSVLTSEAEHRRAVWSALAGTSAGDTPTWTDTVQRWAALYGKEYYQEALLVLWRAVNRVGRERLPVDGLPPREFFELLAEETASTDMEVAGESFSVSGGESTQALLERVEQATATMSLEELRSWAVEADGTCHAALVLLLALLDRLHVTDDFPGDAAWYEVAREGGNNQPGLASFALQLRQHIATGPTVDATLSWLVRRFIISAHERIATTKLPDFTYRFRIEGGRLRFFNRPGLDFGLADSRHSALSSLGRDMDLWVLGGAGPVLTPEGQRLVGTTFK